MNGLVRITAEPKAYPWGGRSFLQDLVERDLDLPIGELWLGTHPNGASRLTEEGTALSALLERTPELLGGLEALPFLMKVMAIEEPLSIQCHPSAEQARVGWAAESEVRKQLPQDRWNYQDPNPKEEMVVALSPMTVMCGILDSSEMERRMRRVLPHSFDRVLGSLPVSLESYMRALAALDPAALAALISEYRASLADEGQEWARERELALRLLALHSSDPWVFAPYLLRVIHLKRGEGLYLKPGIVHAYVQGNAIELMTNSDNIMRAGLTDKHIDLEEFYRVMDSSTDPTELIALTSDGGRSEYRTPSREFRLQRFTDGDYEEVATKPSILLCIEGEAVLTATDQTVGLKRGDALFVGATVGSYHLTVNGEVYCSSAY